MSLPRSSPKNSDFYKIKNCQLPASYDPSNLPPQRQCTLEDTHLKLYLACNATLLIFNNYSVKIGKGLIKKKKHDF